MVEYINYEGTKYPVKIANIAMKDFTAESGVAVGAIGEDLNKHALLLWHGIRVGYLKTGKNFYKNVKGKEVPVLSVKDCLWILDDKFSVYFDILINSMANLAEIDEEVLRDAIDEQIKKK